MELAFSSNTSRDPYVPQGRYPLVEIHQVVWVAKHLDVTFLSASDISPGSINDTWYRGDRHDQRYLLLDRTMGLMSLRPPSLYAGKCSE